MDRFREEMNEMMARGFRPVALRSIEPERKDQDGRPVEIWIMARVKPTREG